MHHLPGIFDLRRQCKRMDQTSSPKPKLVRRNAVKNFDYTPSPFSSASPSTSGSSSRRTWSLDLSYSTDWTTFRVDGRSHEVDLIFQSLGLSGPEDFEIPEAAFETMKSRSSSDVVLQLKRSHFDDSAPEKPQEEEVIQKFVDTSPLRYGNNIQTNDDISEADSGSKKMKLLGIALCSLDRTDTGPAKGGGIKGDRPLLLTPPPVMSLSPLDDTCSTWELLRGLAPDGDEPSHLFYSDISHISDDEEGDGADAEGFYGVRFGETVSMSGSCSLTTTNDDDMSSTTTEPVSIISPSGGCRLTITHWEKGVLLGRGSFGTVYEGISSEGIFFAVKEVSLLEQGRQGKQSVYQLEQEIELLSRFEHENIVRYLGTNKDDSNLYIFLELATQGSLASLYQRYNLRDSHVSAYTRQILLGLKYLHDRNVVHRDIKCANILVASDGTVKLADFGLAKATRLNDLKSCKGTAFWMAPEVVYHKNRGYGLAADIWSLGCTVLEMLTRHVPYHPLELTQALFRIGKGAPPPISDTLSKDARDIVQQCLRVNPCDRPTAAQLLDHPFVRRPLYALLGSESPMQPGK